MLVLAERRWKIIAVNRVRRELAVRPAKGGSPPPFGDEAHPPADGVVEEMRRFWEDLTILGKELLEQVWAQDRLDISDLPNIASELPKSFQGIAIL